MKKIFSIFFIILFISTMVFADGMVHYYADTWQPMRENRQVAAINYENGYENLVLTIDIDQETKGAKAVWMFPVPATPDKTVIDIVDNFPTFSGQNIAEQYKTAMQTYPFISSAYSVIPLVGFLLPFVLMPMIGKISYSQDSMKQIDYVKIHESISKFGITTKLITTESSEVLYEYLMVKGFEMPESSKAVIDDYIGKDYSFVISFIDNLEEYQTYISENKYYYYNQGSLGVFVKFPTDKIYFPLKPTSIYGSTSVPLTLYVTGHVTPELYQEIAGAKTTYMSNYPQYIGNSSTLEKFYNGTTVNRNGFTKIEMNVPSKYFTQDLWINEGAPASIGFKGFVNANTFWVGLIFFAIASILASLSAGIISFGKKIDKKKFALLGLVNFTTIIGMIIAIILLKTKKIDDKLKKDIKASGTTILLFDKMKIVYFVLFFVFFIILNFVIANIFLLF
jgi:hypothetical protein